MPDTLRNAVGTNTRSQRPVAIWASSVFGKNFRVSSKMNTKAKQIELANWQIFLIALYRVGGNDQMVDVETAFIEAHKLASKRFSWRTKELPDIKKLAKALHDADAKGKNYMTGAGKRRQLTAAGLEWIEARAEELSALNNQNTSLGQARSTAGHVMLKRVLKSDEYKAWRANPSAKLERWRLANIFKCSPDSPLDIWISRLEQTGAAAHAISSTDVRKFVDSIKDSIANE